MKSVISIPVHEKPDVIQNQIDNINRFFPEAIIVLHVSAAYYQNYDEKELPSGKKIYINPEHLVTSWGDIIKAHVSNYYCIESLGLNYDYFIMHSSNDMYVQEGVSDYIQKYEAGFNLRYIRQKNSYWWPSALA